MSASDEAIAMATVAARAAVSKLADNVVVIDVSGQLVITDCFVIASATNERQVNAIVDEVEEKMRLAGYKPARREGAREGRWTLLDYVDIVVHIQHRGRAQFLCAGPTLARLPDHSRRSGGAGVRVRRLVMLRHGQTEYNAGNRMQGQLDTDLSELGREQAVAVAEVLAKRQPLVMVSSDLRRALDTADALGERAGLPVRADTRLRETHLGDWQGMTHLEVDASCAGSAPGVAQRRAMGTARRGEPGRRRGALGAAGRGAGRRADRVGDRRTRAAGGAGRSRRVDRRADGGMLELPVDNWPVARWDGQRQLGPAVRSLRGRCRCSTTSGGVWTCGTLRHRSPTMSSDTPHTAGLLRLAFYYGPTGGLPADDPRIWPNIVGCPSRLGCGADRPDRLDLSRRVVGGDPGSALVGRAAAGGCGHLRDLRDGLAAFATADRVA